MDKSLAASRARYSPILEHSEDEEVQLPGSSSSSEKLYEAFNDLHALAQKFQKPFDAPAILVLGHQTDGKSALVEALIGFQFNHVGGGTKTRRPVALHMKYNALCPSPKCMLIGDDMSEQQMQLHELQAYIQQENARLELENKFSSQEMIVRIEYKHCPNLTIIDTPGLISAPPGKAHAGLQAASRAIENMLLAKAQSPELVLLCLEDVCDWSHATTRKLVMQADPGLNRTVMVSTKFDTRIATFSRPADADAFLHPVSLGSSMLGGSPFFTSVPAGRVGDDSECIFSSNRIFRTAVQEREAVDIQELETKLQRRLNAEEKSHIGVWQLRAFLETYLKGRYLRQVPAILPLLEREHSVSSERLEDAQGQLQALNHTDLKDQGRQLTDVFLTSLSHVLRGNASAPSAKYGETLSDEHNKAGNYVLPTGATVTVPEGLPNDNMRLYGGAQFHRAMNEFRLSVGQMTCPEVSREEVANACGLEDAHDGANYTRAACVIAVAKARAIFEPFIHQLGARLSHVMQRMLPVTMYMISQQMQYHQQQQSQVLGPLLKLVGSVFTDFIKEVEASCKSRCLEDLHSTTRYVTWSLHTKGGRSLKAMLSRLKPAPFDANKPTGRDAKSDANNTQAGSVSVLADMLDQVLFNRQLSLTSEELVTALVHQMFEGVRDFVVQAAELKFNTFFLMPVVDQFPVRLRTRMEQLLELDLDSVLQTRAARTGLQQRVQALSRELEQVERLMHKFADIQHRLGSHSGELSVGLAAGLMAGQSLTLIPSESCSPKAAPTSNGFSARAAAVTVTIPVAAQPLPSNRPDVGTVVDQGSTNEKAVTAHPVDVTASMANMSLSQPPTLAVATAHLQALHAASKLPGQDQAVDSSVKLFTNIRQKPAGPAAPHVSAAPDSDARLVRDTAAKFGGNSNIVRAAGPVAPTATAARGTVQ